MFQPVRFGKYFLTERLAVGGMAEIFKAKLYGSDGFEKNLVIKQILPQYAKHRDFVQMFIDEAKICVYLTHGNIVPVYELGKISGIYYLAMDFVDGVTLGELLDESIEAQTPLSLPHALFILSEVLAGLDYAHRKTDEQGHPLRIVHRDISPQNILISFEGEIKIVDFGIARAASKVHATEAGVIKGKYGYMSPEQAAGEEVDQRSDVFSAGVLLYEMLTQERLFEANPSAQSLDKIQKADAQPPSRVNPQVPPELDALVLKALARKPNKRYASAAQLRLDLSRYLYSLEQEASSKTLSAWMNQVFALEIENRRARAEIALPEPKREEPAPIKAELSAPVFVSRDIPASDPMQLFDGDGPLASASPANLLVSAPGSDDEIVDDFSYQGLGRKLKWLVWLGILGGLMLAFFFLADPMGEWFSAMDDAMHEATEHVAEKRLGTLVVRSRPSGASVYFDNRKVGETNVRIRPVDTGKEYELILTLDGYPPWSRKITLGDWSASEKRTISVFKDFTADALR